MDWFRDMQVGWSGEEAVVKAAKELLLEESRPIAFCELEVKILRKLGHAQVCVEIRPTLDYLCNIGTIKVVGTSRFGDALVEIPLLDKLAGL